MSNFTYSERLKRRVQRLAQSGNYTRQEIAKNSGLDYNIILRLTRGYQVKRKEHFGEAEKAATEQSAKPADEVEASLSRVGFEPTSALPGTPEKFQVLAERASRGNPLWHSQDAVTYQDAINRLGQPGC